MCDHIWTLMFKTCWDKKIHIRLMRNSCKSDIFVKLQVLIDSAGIANFWWFWNFYCKETFFLMLCYNLYLYESKTSIIIDSNNWDHNCLICHVCGFCPCRHCTTIHWTVATTLISPVYMGNGHIYALRFIKEPIKPYIRKPILPGYPNMPDQPDHFDWSKELPIYVLRWSSVTVSKDFTVFRSGWQGRHHNNEEKKHVSALNTHLGPPWLLYSFLVTWNSHSVLCAASS